MKKSYIIGALVLLGTALSSCDDFLDKSRYPYTSEVDSPAFWSQEPYVQQEIDRMKNFFDGYGYGNTTGTFFFSQLSDDQAGNSFREWHDTSVPARGGFWQTGYEQLRHVMCIIDGVKGSSIEDRVKPQYLGVARLMRGYVTWQLVKRYGDVVWLEHTVQVSDDGILYGPRQNRDVVMDSVLADLDYAIANIPAQAAKSDWSKDLALAIKSDICLYEGTYCRYRTAAENILAPDETRAKKYLNEAANASLTLINSGRYELSADYRSKYNSTRVPSLENSEIILTRTYDEVNSLHSTVSYTCSSTAVSGITKDLFDNFLFKDGKPLALTSLNKSDVGEVDGDGNYSIAKLLEVRDARLTKITDPIVYYTGMTWSRAGAMQMTSSTGYGVSKFDNIDLPVTARQNSAANYTSCPLYYLSLIYCNYAEAKAELGTLTNDDLNLTVNKLYARAELPAVTVADLTAMTDPANNMNVSNLIWEIRRCRRCELTMDKDYRYFDLVRWHKLDLLDSRNHPNILLGANMTKAPVTINNVNGYVDATYGQVRTYEARQYFYPIPSGQIALNSKIGQNPGWK